MVDRRPKRRVKNTDEVKPDDSIDWYMWLPCTGVNGLIPPLANWNQLNDGTYSLGDVERMNQVINDRIESHKRSQINTG